MKQFLTVLNFELNNYFKNKSFVITTLLLAIVVAGIVIVPTLIPGFLDDEEDGAIPENEYVEDDESIEEDESGMDILGICILEEAKEVDLETINAAYPAEWATYETEEALRKAVENEEIDAGFVMKSSMDVVYIVNNLSMHDYIGESFQYSLAEMYKQQYLMDKGLTADEIWESESFWINMEEEALGKNSEDNYMYTYILIFVIYMLIIFYGQMIATSVTTEKSNRAVEILVTSVNSNSLICGKVLAGAIAGVLQAGVILGSGFAAYHLVGEKWDGILDFLFDIPANVLLAFAFFSIFSYVLYAFIFGMLGALVSKTEDISKSASPLLMVYIVSFMIGMFGLTNSDGIVVKIASFIPFTSGNAMFVRISMGNVAGWEVLVSAVLLVVSCVIAGVLAAKIFRFGTLHYGNPIKLKTAIKKASMK